MPYNKVYRKSQIKLEVLNMIAKSRKNNSTRIFCLIDSNFNRNNYSLYK
jgi:hypothetical protein